MLTSVHIRNLQSLAKVDVRLGRLTVVTGASDVGKSALVRALRLLARNGSSTGLVREGAGTLTVAVTQEDGPSLKLTRGPRTSEYEVVADGAKEVYAKCGTSVPGEVAKWWRLPELAGEHEVTFAFQHDAPFLLDEPGSSVARTIGTLTNASMLSDAVREANRRRIEAAQEERSLRREAEECAADLAAMGDVRGRVERIKAVRAVVTQASASEALRDTLRAMVAAAERTVTALTQARSASGPSEAAIAAVVAAEDALSNRDAFGDVVDTHAALVARAADADAKAQQWTSSAEALTTQAREALIAAGRCPLCKQSVKRLRTVGGGT